MWTFSILFLLHFVTYDAQATLDERNTTSSTTTTTTTQIPSTISPAPTVPIYHVSEGNVTCLLVQMNLQLGITYFNKKGEPLMRNFYINSTTDYEVNSTGKCTKELDSLNIQWWPENPMNGTPRWSLLFNFRKRTNDHFSLDYMEFSYATTDSLFPDTNETASHRVALNDSQFTCPLGSFFKCMAQQTSKLTKLASLQDDVLQPEVFLTISNLKAEAFRQSNSTVFIGSMRECSADYVPNKVVPIVVGVALALMIVIALITFIIGSRRRQQGYQEI